MREEIEALRHTVHRLEREATALLRAIEAELERPRPGRRALAVWARNDAWRWN